MSPLVVVLAQGRTLVWVQNGRACARGGVTLAYRDALEWAADRIEQGWHDKEGE